MGKHKAPVWWLIFLLPMLLAGCVSTNLGNAIGAAYLTIQTTADAIQAECQNITAGGPCVNSSAISTDEKNRFKGMLSSALNDVDSAARLYRAGEAAQAGSRFDIASGVLREIENELIRRGVDQ